MAGSRDSYSVAGRVGGNMEYSAVKVAVKRIVAKALWLVENCTMLGSSQKAMAVRLL